MINALKHLKDFETILADYHISPAGREVLTNTRLTLLIGASATGRDRLITELLKTGEYYHIVSDTTRKPRVNDGVLEQNGREYWFRSEDEFLTDLRAGKLLEAEIIHAQQVSGISIRELAKANEAGKVAITNVDLNIKAIVDAKPDAHAILVLPPSFEVWMQRLDGRGMMPLVEKRRRLETAHKIFQAGIEWDIFDYVVNDTIPHALEQINAVVAGKRLPSQRELIEQLRNETKSHLETVS